MSKEELKIISDLFGTICDYSPPDDYMSEHCGDWCAEHCGQVEEWECWKKYIQTKMKEEYPRISTRLNKCPQCNKRPEIWVGSNYYEIKCPVCEKSVIGSTEMDARVKWNEATSS